MRWRGGGHGEPEWSGVGGRGEGGRGIDALFEEGYNKTQNKSHLVKHLVGDDSVHLPRVSVYVSCEKGLHSGVLQYKLRMLQ